MKLVPCSAVVALTLLAAPPARGDTATPDALPPPPPPPSSLQAKPPSSGLPRWGLLVDAGVPDGASVSALFRPVPLVRLSLGPTWNYLGYGVQAGVGLTPFRWALTPSLNLDGGRYFRSDLRFLSSQRGVPDQLKPILDKVSYGYVSGQLGLEVGSPSGFSFFVRAGLSYVWTTVRGTATSTVDAGSGTTVQITNPKFTGTLPSVKLGCIYFF